VDVRKLIFPGNRGRGRPKGRRESTIIRERHMAHEVVRLEHDGVEPGEAKELVGSAFAQSRRQVDRALALHRAEAEDELPNYVKNLVRLGKLPRQ
jgi:hypothetical protein